LFSSSPIQTAKRSDTAEDRTDFTAAAAGFVRREEKGRTLSSAMPHHETGDLWAKDPPAIVVAPFSGSFGKSSGCLRTLVARVGVTIT
jgi:hypothetical protein